MYDTKIITANSELSLANKKVVKKITQGRLWPIHNYNLYQRYSEIYPYAVKVLKWIDENEIKMERVNVELSFSDLLEYERDKLHTGVTKERVHRAVMFYQGLQNDFYKFSFEEMPKTSMPSKYFYHHDLNLSNIVFDMNDNIKLIDPNGFWVSDMFVNRSYIVNFNSIMWKAHLTLQRLEDG